MGVGEGGGAPGAVERCRYVVVVADEDALLQRQDELAQEVEPLLFHADLAHVDVARRHVLVAAVQARILGRRPVDWLHPFNPSNPFNPFATRSQPVNVERHGDIAAWKNNSTAPKLWNVHRIAAHLLINPSRCETKYFQSMPR